MIIFLIILCIIYIVKFYFPRHCKLNNAENIIQNVVFNYRLIALTILGVIAIVFCKFYTNIKFAIYIFYGLLLIGDLVFSTVIKIFLKIVYMLDKKSAKADEGYKICFIDSVTYLFILLTTYYLYN